MDSELDKMKKEHENSYKKAILNIIDNNTKSLVNDDIKMLLNKPPLDSMDTIKLKILELAKKNKIVINTEKLNNIIIKYRKNLIKVCNKIMDIRITPLNKKVKNYKFIKENDIIRINRKDFIDINKQIKKELKDSIHDCFDNYILKDIQNIFDKSIDKNICENVINEFSKYFFKTYNKQLFENIDIKILVKDTTLINSTKEQGERYLFIIRNSRIFNN